MHKGFKHEANRPNKRWVNIFGEFYVGYNDRNDFDWTKINHKQMNLVKDTNG